MKVMWRGMDLGDKLQVYGSRNGLSEFVDLSDKLQIYGPRNAISKLMDLNDTLLTS